VAFFVVPIYAILAVAFGGIDPILRTSEPAWSPLDWDTTSMRSILDRVFGGDLGGVFVRTTWFVALALAGCIAIGYPIAYFVARRAGRSRGVVLAALVMPFWISYLMRMLAWTNLLQPDGYVNRVLQWLGVLNAPRNWLDGDWPTVVIGLTYGYVPFFILPLYATLERIDERLIEAGRDLGASSWRTFLAVTLPLSVPGLMAAA
jgi:spermidine/putrescine transport system permease protein